MDNQTFLNLMIGMGTFAVICFLLGGYAAWRDAKTYRA